jgi:hypothetical protein
VLVPWIVKKIALWKRTVAKSNDVPQYEEETTLNKFTGTLDEYAEMGTKIPRNRPNF